MRLLFNECFVLLKGDQQVNGNVPSSNLQDIEHHSSDLQDIEHFGTPYRSHVYATDTSMSWNPTSRSSDPPSRPRVATSALRASHGGQYTNCSSMNRRETDINAFSPPTRVNACISSSSNDGYTQSAITPEMNNTRDFNSSAAYSCEPRFNSIRMHSSHSSGHNGQKKKRFWTEAEKQW